MHWEFAVGSVEENDPGIIKEIEWWKKNLEIGFHRHGEYDHNSKIKKDECKQSH